MANNTRMSTIFCASSSCNENTAAASFKNSISARFVRHNANRFAHSDTISGAAVVRMLVSMIVVAVSKPKIFAETTVIGKTIVIALFIVGVIHLVGRIKDGYDRYTFDEELIHESILDENEPKQRPYSRWAATVFLIGGLLFSFGLGYIVGLNVDFIAASMPSWFSNDLKPEFLFYPPIIVLFVDIMHAFASRFE